MNDRICTDANGRKYINNEPRLHPDEKDKFCDTHCVWTDHHPDCVFGRREPTRSQRLTEAGYSRRPKALPKEDEPLGWLYESKAGVCTFHLVSNDKRFQADWEAAQQYPESHKMTPLYLHPPQRKPLTEEFIKIIIAAEMCGLGNVASLVDIGRAIERAHGIGVRNE